MQILGDCADGADGADVTLLLDNGTDVHSYQPSVSDLVTISECDIFIYVGGNTESWVEDALKNVSNSEMKVICLTDVLSDRVVEDDHEGAEDHDHDHEKVIDEHIWLSLRNVQICCEYIADQISACDPENADEYKENAANYCNVLSALDTEYRTAVDGAKFNALIFADRFPFRYLVDDYSIEYFAAFSGCSTETDASFETVAFLVDKLNETGVGGLIVIDGSDKKLANTVKANSMREGIEIYTLDSMQSVTASDIKSGTTYLSVMKENLDTLKKALN
jgi:zinc transport system substrate-binding protein